MNYVLDFLDQDGKRYVFDKKNFIEHSKRHPELNEKGYLYTIKNYILSCNPSMIYPAYKQNNRYVYYDLVGTTGKNSWYNTAVIQKTKKLYIIITAYRFCGPIRETKYSGPLNKRP